MISYWNNKGCEQKFIWQQPINGKSKITVAFSRLNYCRNPIIPNFTRNFFQFDMSNYKL
jgi:hypothetical protein